MYRAFTAKNFRCFRELSLSSLERVNLITGKNNTGKTALLEALFLHSGPHNPALPAHIHSFRGIKRLEFDAEVLWGWLFYGKQMDKTIEFQSQSDTGEERSVTIRLVTPEVTHLMPASGEDRAGQKAVVSLLTEVAPGELVIDFHGDGQSGTARATIVNHERIDYQRAPSSFFPDVTFCIASGRFSLEDVKRFSRLEEIGRQDEILLPLRQIEPRLRHLTLLVPADEPMLHGDIGAGRLVSLPMMGEGIVRLAAILLAIASAAGGYVLVDEIENGLHYSVLRDVWRAVGEAARKNDVQVFATTHSWECIRAAHEVFSAGEPYDFRLYRLDRVGDDIRAVTYTSRMLETALVTGLEVR